MTPENNHSTENLGQFFMYICLSFFLDYIDAVKTLTKTHFINVILGVGQKPVNVTTLLQYNQDLKDVAREGCFLREPRWPQSCF